MLPRVRWIILGLLFSSFAVFDLSIATVVEMRGNEETVAFILGTVFAQVIVLAVWSALGPASVFTRMVSGLVLVVLVCLSIFAFGRGDEEVVAVAGAMFVQWFAVQVPLWVIRLGFGWRLAWPGEETSGANPNETQFGIRQLLVWTTLVGVALGIGRLILPREALQDMRQPGEAVSILVLLAVFNSLLAWPIVWAAFVRHWMPLWMVGAWVCGAGICVAEVVAFKAALGFVDEEMFWLINGIQLAAGSGTLLLVRICGFRLVRTRRDRPANAED